MVEGLILFSIGFVGLSLIGVKRYKEAKRKRLQETLDKWIDVIIDLYEKEKDE